MPARITSIDYRPPSESDRSEGLSPDLSEKRRSIDLRHHVLDLRVVLERVRAQVLAVAGLLVAAVRHLRDQRDVVVDPDRPELELARGVQRPADIARPDRRREAVLH